MFTNHRHYAPQLAAAYDRTASRYRSDDEIEVRSENHLRIGGNLRRICRSFASPIRVLDIGCGTGRYFHWLEDVRLLVGTDLSAAMLQQAHRPVRADQIRAGEIRLIAGNIYDMTFEPGSFELIYCLGVLGYGAALTPGLAKSVHTWLAPGGRLYFDAIETYPQEKKDRCKQAIKSLLPRTIQHRIESRRKHVPVFRHTCDLVARVMESSGFSDFSLSSNTCKSPLWSGVHIECLARKYDPDAVDTRRLNLDFNNGRPRVW